MLGGNSPFSWFRCFSRWRTTILGHDSTLGNLLEMQILRPHSDPWKQKLVSGPSNVFITRLPGDSDTCSSLRSTAVEKLCWSLATCLPILGEWGRGGGREGRSDQSDEGVWEKKLGMGGISGTAFFSSFWLLLLWKLPACFGLLSPLCGKPEGQALSCPRGSKPGKFNLGNSSKFIYLSCPCSQGYIVNSCFPSVWLLCLSLSWFWTWAGKRDNFWGAVLNQGAVMAHLPSLN